MLPELEQCATEYLGLTHTGYAVLSKLVEYNTGE